ncbi:protein kinase domain-containing protein [Streptomyces sp. NPDC001920]
MPLARRSPSCPTSPKHSSTSRTARSSTRDLKPENILLLGGRRCLAGFGIARYAEATTAKRTFKFHGTFASMLPERWNNQRATSASDIYALGVPAFELLESVPPFTGPDEHDYHDQHLHGVLPPFTTAPPPPGGADHRVPLPGPAGPPGGRQRARKAGTDPRGPALRRAGRARTGQPGRGCAPSRS